MKTYVNPFASNPDFLKFGDKAMVAASNINEVYDKVHAACLAHGLVEGSPCYQARMTAVHTRWVKDEKPAGDLTMLNSREIQKFIKTELFKAQPGCPAVVIECQMG